MKTKSFRYETGTVKFYMEGSFRELEKVEGTREMVFITDEIVYELHKKKFDNCNVIVLDAGEEIKNQITVDRIIENLLDAGVSRSVTLVGVGGGVVTDITGYVGTIYMRGVRFGFVPTTLLAMVDAAIGGKNGVNVGIYKNMVGTIVQPSFILYDFSFLKTLPHIEWKNGFAEIIKHASIANAGMFVELENKSPGFYRKNSKSLQKLIYENAFFKSRAVKDDEFESGKRKLLNFGHTLGHALEIQYGITHGEAISIGMSFAGRVSKNLLGFKSPDRLDSLLKKYGLPVEMDYDKEKVFRILKMDKKRMKDHVSFILLRSIGRAGTFPLSLEMIYEEI